MRMTDGRWTVDTPAAREVLFPFLHCHSKVHGFRGKESPCKTLKNSEPLSDVKVAFRSKTTRGHRHIQIFAESELKDASEALLKRQKDWTEETK